MQFARINDVVLHYSFRPGTPNVVPVVFSNSLGTDNRIWEDVVERLPSGIPVLLMDKRGHGLSDLGPIDIPTLSTDIATLMDRLGLTAALVFGVSVGGLIAQCLALSRADLVSGLVLSNTGTKIGTAEVWNDRIAAVRSDGIDSIADSILTCWFSEAFRANSADRVAGYRNMLCRTTAEGYAGTCEAIRDTDFTACSTGIAVPTICVSGGEDLATPPDVVERLAATIEGASYRHIDGIGHLPPIEVPEAVVEILVELHGRLG